MKLWACIKAWLRSTMDAPETYQEWLDRQW